MRPLLVVLVLGTTAFGACLGHCGPRLTGLDFTAQFDSEWDSDNRSRGEQALSAMGFRPHQEFPGWYEKDGLEGKLLVDKYNQGTRLLFDVSHDWIGYETMDEARAAGMAMAPPHWTAFNATVDDFAKRMTWSPPAQTAAEPTILIC